MNIRYPIYEGVYRILTFKTKERIKLTYSSAKVLRVLNGKTRSSRSGFEKNLPCAINGTRYFFQKPCFS